MNPSKEERFVEYMRRLNEAPAASSLNEAIALIGDTLNAVEDEMTDIVFDPEECGIHKCLCIECGYPYE